MNGRDHMARIAAMRCIHCELSGQDQQGRTYVHHIREGQGMAQRASDYLTVPLCYEHHQGINSVHGTRAYLRISKLSELDLLAETIARL